MQVEQETPVQGSGSAIIGVFKAVSVLTAVLILVQAVLASQGFWRAAEFPDLIEIHGVVGNLLFVVVIVQAALALYGTTKRLLDQHMAILNLAILGLVVTQIGLGYSGRESAVAVSWHVPNGVLLFGLAVLSATLAVTRKRATSSQER